jgi:hypothetical protein
MLSRPVERKIEKSLANSAVSLPRRTREVYAIVPSRNARGRELSLVDAADELRRIERATRESSLPRAFLLGTIA